MKLDAGELILGYKQSLFRLLLQCFDMVYLLVKYNTSDVFRC